MKDAWQGLKYASADFLLKVKEKERNYVSLKKDYSLQWIFFQFFSFEAP